MARLEAMLAERRMLVAGYRQRLADLHDAGKLRFQVLPEGSDPAHQSFAVRLAESFSRSGILAGLAERGIGCGVATYSFAELGIYPGPHDAPEARALHERGISLPLYIGMRSSELDRVTGALEALLQ
jgi:dTDP-4-amino-4,6-dideoxygalactose transaminase